MNLDMYIRWLCVTVTVAVILSVSLFIQFLFDSQLTSDMGSKYQSSLHTNIFSFKHWFRCRNAHTHRQTQADTRTDFRFELIYLKQKNPSLSPFNDKKVRSVALYNKRCCIVCFIWSLVEPIKNIMWFFPINQQIPISIFGDSIDYSNAFSNVNTKSMCECECKRKTHTSSVEEHQLNLLSSITAVPTFTSIDFTSLTHMQRSSRTQSSIYYVLFFCVRQWRETVTVEAIEVPSIVPDVPPLFFILLFVFHYLGISYSMNWYFIIVDPMSQSHKQSL